MHYRTFGHTGLPVSEVGFGAWAIGGDATVGSIAIGWGPADDALSRKAIVAALDAGINFFDTADIYGLGHSENLLGEMLAGHQEVIIATKGGNTARNQQFTSDYSKEHLMAACEQSLKRLRREAIDYYQLHSARLVHLEQGECIEALQLLQQQGKIRYWGLSLNTFDPAPEAGYLMHHNVGAGFQLVLNIINQRALNLIKEAAAKGYGIIARMPLQFGLLTGKFDVQTTFGATDHRHNRLPGSIISEANEALRPVWKLCEKYSITPTALALSYVLSYEEVSTVIPGIRTPEHVHSNTTGLVKLAAEDRRLIEWYGETAFAELMKKIEQQG